MQVEIGEWHVDALAARGHYDERIERVNPSAAITAALMDLLETLLPATH